MYIYITHPLKKYKRGGVYAAKNVLFTCFFLGFPREKFYTPRSVRGGGGRWMGLTKAVRTTPPSLIHFAEVLEFLGFLGVLNPWAFILFTYVLANHSVGIPRIPQCSMNPPVYTFYVRVSILDIHRSAGIHCPLSFILFMFSRHPSCWTEKKNMFNLPVAVLPKAFFGHTPRLLSRKSRTA